MAYNLMAKGLWYKTLMQIHHMNRFIKVCDLHSIANDSQSLRRFVASDKLKLLEQSPRQKTVLVAGYMAFVMGLFVFIFVV